MEFPSPFFLAPMAGISDASFRRQCRNYGAGLTVTELTSVEGIVRKEEKLNDVLDVQKNEFPSIQLFGCNVDTIIKAAKIVEKHASIIDFNLGCPAPHITRQEAGAALLMHPDRLHQIFSRLVKAVKLPVTAKIRAGPNDNHLVYKKVALVLQKAGIKMLTIHPRTIKQGYSGTADWNRIKDLVELLDIPVCGNGDITSPEKAKEMMDYTGCKYVMIGRAARGDPFLFKQCVQYMKTGTYDTIKDEEYYYAWKEYLKYALEYNIKSSRLKLQAQQYVRGLNSAKRIKEKLSVAKSVQELEDAMDLIIKSTNHDQATNPNEK